MIIFVTHEVFAPRLHTGEPWMNVFVCVYLCVCFRAGDYLRNSLPVRSHLTHELVFVLKQFVLFATL